MNSTPAPPNSQFTNHGDPISNASLPLNPLALLSFVFGIFSLLALLGQTWWYCAGIGLLGCTLILLHMHRSQNRRVGMTLAIVGLAISLMATTFAPTYYFLRQAHIQRQAAAIGQQWLKSIMDGEPYIALVAMENPETRIIKADLQDFLSSSSKNHRAYKQFVSQKLIRSLTNFSGNSQIHLHTTENIVNGADADIVTNLYAVTDDENSQNHKTLFVRLVIERTFSPGSKIPLWKILRYRGVARPRA